jgi:hypothetical protein
MSGQRLRRIAGGAVTLAAFALLAGLAFQRTGDVARAEYPGGGGTPFEVGSYGCIVARNGQRTVPAGSTIVIRNGWTSTKIGSVYAFLDAEQSILSVNDGHMVDVSGQYTAPQRDPIVWATWLRYPTGVTLASAGDSMRFTFTLIFTRPVTDVSDLDGDGTPDPLTGAAGLVFGGTCTVTAA